MFRILFLLLLLLMMAVGGAGYWIYEHRLTAPLPIHNDRHYTVKPNATVREVAMDFMEEELFDYPTAFAWVSWARWWEKKAHLIKAGEYLIPVGTTPKQLFKILIAGKAIQHTLTIPEGWNFRQVMAAIRKHPKLVQTLDKKLDNAEIMSKLGHPDKHPEGRFYPDTYHFPTDTTDVEFLQRAIEMMKIELKAAWEKRGENLPVKTDYEALILASIVEKETGVAEERPRIAGVFARRLQKNMLLQTDPTVIYALGETYDGNIRLQDLKNKSPYNTYVHKGLPPTPIAMPGRASLYAAVNPAEGDEIFFVAKGKGSHYFSATYKEHACAVIEYQLKEKSSRKYERQCRKYPRCAACSS